jgi:hypothetical protein
MAEKLLIRPFHPEDQDAVLRLWADCGLISPENDTLEDIQRTLQVNPEGSLVGLNDGTLVATCWQATKATAAGSTTWPSHPITRGQATPVRS